MNDQRCGTCRWAVQVVLCNQPWIECSVPTPASVVEKMVMKYHEGTTCPCYQPAPQPQEDCPDAD